MKKVTFLLVFFLSFSCGFAQNEKELAANTDFLSYFPVLTQKSKIDVESCYKAVKKGTIPFEKINAIKHKEMLYMSADAETMKNWHIFPLGKYQISENIYLVLYFSDYMGGKRGDNELDHMLNISTLDISKSTQISTNQGNDGEYINKSEDVLMQLIDFGIDKKTITRNADFVWKFVSESSVSLKSSWVYADDSKKDKEFSISWDKEGNLKFD